MPTFELQGPDGKTYEVEAPSADAAVGAFKQFSTPEAPDKRTEAERRADARVTKDRSENRGVMQTIDDTVRNLARGTPVGSFMDEIAARGNELIGGEPYAEGVEYQRATDRAIDAEATKVGELPIIGDVTTGGLTKLTGAIASAPFAPAVRAFGGGSLLAGTGNAMATGAAYGGLYGAGEGEGTERGANAMLGAGAGAVIGAPIPALAAGVRNGFNAMANAARKLPGALAPFSKGAVKRVSRAVTDDGLGAGNYHQRAQELGPEGMLADMGPNLENQAGAIASQPGRGQQIVLAELAARRAGAAGRIEGDVNQTMGPARNLVQLEENVVGQSRTQAAPHYDQFYQTIVPQTADLTAVMQRVPQRVMAKAEELAALDPNYARYAAQTGEPNGIVYDLVKRAADDLARAAGRGTNEERLFSALARDLRNAVDNALSPGQPQAGPWAVARSIAGDGMQFREGLEEGGKAFSRGTNPDQMAADLGGMSHVQRLGYNEGARGQVRDIMGNASTSFGENSATATRKALGSDYARQKVALVAGQTRADQLIRRLEAESTFQNTSNNVTANSRTAVRTAAQKEFPNAADTSAATEVGKKSLSGVAMEAAYRIGNALLGGALNANRVQIAADAARMLVAQGSSRDAIARGLRDYARDRRVTGQAARAIERVARAALEGSRQRAVDSAVDP